VLERDSSRSLNQAVFSPTFHHSPQTPMIHPPTETLVRSASGVIHACAVSTSVVLSDLSFSAPDGRRLFSDLNLDFGPERAGLVGRNGVGKTTWLRLVAGELLPSSGRVAVSRRLGVLRQGRAAGPAVARHPSRRRTISPIHAGAYGDVHPGEVG